MTTLATAPELTTDATHPTPAVPTGRVTLTGDADEVAAFAAAHPQIIAVEQSYGSTPSHPLYTTYWVTDPVEFAAEKAKIEIREEIETGRVPASVATFSELHDYLDANTLGGLTTDAPWVDHSEPDPRMRGLTDYGLERAGEVQEIVNDWLVAGRPSGSLPTTEHGKWLADETPDGLTDSIITIEEQAAAAERLRITQRLAVLRDLHDDHTWHAALLSAIDVINEKE